MKTSSKSRKTATTGRHRRNRVATQPVPDNIQQIAIDRVDFNPKNHRKLYSHAALKDFAKVLTVHGIIHALTLRPKEDGRFELVSGERRLRAALIAKFTHVPAIVKQYTDAEVNEIQLSENLQREDPHPLHIAQAIGIMKDSGQSVRQIATRLGKSPGFVYIRLKLLSLTEDFQEMFLAAVLNIDQAFEIASLSADSQEDLFTEECADWKDRPTFRLRSLAYLLDRYKYDLDRAPFDITNRKLVPAAGACTGCPHNTACLKTLFPELAKEKLCTNSSCYTDKCNAHFKMQLRDEVDLHQPAAFIRYDHDSSLIDETLAGFSSISQFLYNDVTICREPHQPDRDMYMVTPEYDNEEIEEEESEEEEAEDTEPEEEQLDEEAYAEAMHEYTEDLAAFERDIQDGTIKKGLIVTERTFSSYYFRIGKVENKNNTVKVTAKQVQEAIKSKTATPELLQAEIKRLEEREERSKELDTEKVHLTVHEQFCDHIGTQAAASSLTPTDAVAARLLVYQSLSSKGRDAIKELMTDGRDEMLLYAGKVLYDKLEKLTDEQYSYMIRLALVGKPESKFPSNVTAHFTYRTAEAAGIDVKGIKETYAEKVEAREDRLEARRRGLEKLINRLNRQRSL